MRQPDRRLLSHPAFRVLLCALLCALTIVVARDDNPIFAQAGGAASAAHGSPGPAAESCGAPAAGTQPGGGRGQQPVFPPGQYPVQLPAVSLLGARNDLPNPFRPGVDWGQLPAGRTWGSSASITT